MARPRIPLRRASHRQFDKRAAIYEHRAVAEADDRPLERRLFDLDRAGLTEQAHDAIDLSLPPRGPRCFSASKVWPADPAARAPGPPRAGRPRPTRRPSLTFARPRSRPSGAPSGPTLSLASTARTPPATYPRSPSTRPITSTCSSLAAPAGRGRAATPARAGRRAATTRRRHRSARSRSTRPDSNIVYCATGDGQGAGYLGVGLLRSTDGGRTWQTRCTAHFFGVGFFDLKVLPGGHLFAGTIERPLRVGRRRRDLAPAAHAGDVVAGGGLGSRKSAVARGL